MEHLAIQFYEIALFVFINKIVEAQAFFIILDR